MRLALLLAALTALVIAAPAGAHRDGGGHHGGPGWDEGPRFAEEGEYESDDYESEDYDEYENEDFDAFAEEEAEEVPYEFSGRIRAVDVDDSTIVVRLGDRGPRAAGRRGHHRPRGPHTLEFLVDEDTSIERNDADATLADLKNGEKVDVTVVASEYADLDEIQETPAFIVSAYSVQSFYGFAGRVVATEDGKITVDVRKATKAAKPLLEGTTERVFTFAVDEETAGNTSPAVGKLVGIGIAGAKDATLEQVLATPADVVLRGGGGAARLSRAAASRAKSSSR